MTSTALYNFHKTLTAPEAGSLAARFAEPPMTREELVEDLNDDRCRKLAIYFGTPEKGMVDVKEFMRFWESLTALERLNYLAFTESLPPLHIMSHELYLASKEAKERALKIRSMSDRLSEAAIAKAPNEVLRPLIEESMRLIDEGPALKKSVVKF